MDKKETILLKASKQAFDDITSSITITTPFLVVFGGVGTGKTTLVKFLYNQMDATKPPSVSKEKNILLKMVSLIHKDGRDQILKRIQNSSIAQRVSTLCDISHALSFLHEQSPTIWHEIPVMCQSMERNYLEEKSQIASNLRHSLLQSTRANFLDVLAVLEHGPVTYNQKAEKLDVIFHIVDSILTLTSTSNTDDTFKSHTESELTIFCFKKLFRENSSYNSSELQLQSRFCVPQMLYHDVVLESIHYLHQICMESLECIAEITDSRRIWITVSYKPTTKGRHQLHISKQITETPFHVAAIVVYKEVSSLLILVRHTKIVALLLQDWANIIMLAPIKEMVTVCLSEKVKMELYKLIENSPFLQLQMKERSIVQHQKQAYVRISSETQYCTSVNWNDIAKFLNVQDTIGQSPLMYARANGCFYLVKLILALDGELNLQDKNGQTALMLACKNGHFDTAQLLLEKGAQVDLQDSYGWSALAYATSNEQTEVANLLILNGANIDLRSNNKLSPLSIACRNGYLGMVKLLLENGAQVDLQDSNGWSALIHACHIGYLDMVKLLLENSAQVDLQDSNGWSALIHASCNGYLDMVKLLLENNAQVDLQDSNGWSALMHASLNWHYEVAILLIKNGANVDLQSSNNLACGWSALMIAYKSESPYEDSQHDNASVKIGNNNILPLLMRDISTRSTNQKNNSDIKKPYSKNDNNRMCVVAVCQGVHVRYIFLATTSCNINAEINVYVREELSHLPIVYFTEECAKELSHLPIAYLCAKELSHLPIAYFTEEGAKISLLPTIGSQLYLFSQLSCMKIQLYASYFVLFFQSFLLSLCGSLSRLVQALSLLMLQAGDVELNPGPPGKCNVNKYMLTLA